MDKWGEDRSGALAIFFFFFFFLDNFSRMVPIFTSAGQWLPVIVRPDPLRG